MKICANRSHKITLLVIVSVLMMLAVLVPSTFAYEGVSIQIPALGVETSVTEFQLNGRSWNINPWEGGIGHLQGTGWFDAGGNIALGGHSWMPNNTPGIFANLHTVHAGDEVIVSVNGEQRHYQVSNVTSVSMYDLSVLYPIEGEQITLITCDAASFDPNSSLYQQRVIVTAQRIS
ncbi:MAG: sortase [Anaerolineae bacterium]|nr:sortase [Anaerolineae bacterium]